MTSKFNKILLRHFLFILSVQKSTFQQILKLMQALKQFFINTNKHMNKNKLKKKMHKKCQSQSTFALSCCYRNGTEQCELIYDQNKGGEQRIGFIELEEGVTEYDIDRNYKFMFVKDIRSIKKKENLLTIQSKSKQTQVFGFFDNGSDKPSNLIHDWHVFLLEKMFQISENRRYDLKDQLRISKTQIKSLQTQKAHSGLELLQLKHKLKEEQNAWSDKLWRLTILIEELKQSPIDDLSVIGFNMERQFRRSSQGLKLEEIFIEEEKKEENSFYPIEENSKFVSVEEKEENLSKSRPAFSVHEAEGQISTSNVLPMNIDES